MGSLSLQCPLCCTEKFSTLHGLKHHLLSVIDNLTCSSCNERFQSVRELIDHLDRESCGSKEEQRGIKKETEDIEEVIQKSILAKALLKKSDGTAGPMEETPDAPGEEMEEQEVIDEEEDGGEELYECSTCQMQFASIEEHIREFHEGTEVVLQDVDNVEANYRYVELTVEPDATMNTSQQDSDSPDDDITFETVDTDGLIKNEFPQILNTLQQKDCLDKDGLRYTRKIVKIEKFWSDTSVNPRPPPIIEKYILEDGKARKVESEPVEEIASLMELYNCPNCEHKFSKMEQYYKHKCAGVGKEYKCSKCDSTFTSTKLLKAHMKEHKTEDEEAGDGNSYVCEECNTDFPSYKSLRLHKRMHDPIKSREVEAPVSYGINGTTTEQETGPREMFICQLCNKTMDKQYEEAHMTFHKTDNKYDCEICNRKFYTESNLEMHMRVHSNGKKFTCSYCKKAFLVFESLQDHVQNQCQKRKYECQYCGRRFARPHEKVKHERIHTGEKPHVCSICGKSFRVSYCLTLHMRTHSGTRPYQCPYCSKRFKAHSVFNHHLLTHSDVRAYKCPYCPKAFKTGVQLAGHKNSHIKPFTCTQCNRPFASLYAVRAHMETHNRENNLKFNCWTCGASYARAFALRDHMKEHHGDQGNAEEATNAIITETEEGAVLVTLEEAEEAGIEAVQAIVTE